VQLQTDLKRIDAAGMQVVGISYDSVQTLAEFAKKSQITFPLLSDSGSKTIIAFGLLNKEAKDQQAGIPYPGTMVLDQQGVIRAKLFLARYQDRHSTDALIKAVREIAD
jgi:peroxiredoxin Q/BCP